MVFRTWKESGHVDFTPNHSHPLIYLLTTPTFKFIYYLRDILIFFLFFSKPACWIKPLPYALFRKGHIQKLKRAYTKCLQKVNGTNFFDVSCHGFCEWKAVDFWLRIADFQPLKAAVEGVGPAKLDLDLFSRKSSLDVLDIIVVP